MKLKSLNLTLQELESYGLQDFYCTKFNNVIALVGKNGSGKSRYLNAIHKNLLNSDLSSNLKLLFSEIPLQLENFLENSEKKLELYNLYNKIDGLQKELQKSPNDKNLSNKFNELNYNYNNDKDVRSGIFNMKLYLKENELVRKEIAQRIKIVKSSDLRKLQDGFDLKGEMTFQNIIDSTADSLDVDEFSIINQSAFSFLQRLPHKLAFDEIDCRGDEKKFKNRITFRRFTILKNLIHEFLDKELNWHSKNSDVSEYDDHVNIKTTGYLTIDDRNLNYNDFSDGEKVLFTYAILLFLLSTNPKIKFSESIIIIDEPELNLHPKAQIKLMKTLENLIADKGQLIIATHSLSIVSNLDYGSIFLVRKNKLYTPKSSAPFNAVEDLMGFEEHYNKIMEFLISTPSWAMTNFMAQCFEDPEVFESASRKDPQLELFKVLLQQRNNLSILDYGSGQGRLLERLKENEEAWERIKLYDCFDIETKYNETVLEKGASKVINDLKEIPLEGYDLVVIVNVLHEIHVKHWVVTLNKIKKSLKPEGFIAIIEDTELPIGELPNDIGFLLLGKEEMTKLIGDKINFLTPNQDRYKERIICGIINKENFESINKKKILTVLELLQKNSLQKICEYRTSNNKEASLGRLYALKSNSYVNSQLAINYLNSEKSDELT